MGDICEICKKKAAQIGIGEHSYCFDCHNKMVLQQMGIEDTYDYVKSISLMGPGGRMHTFEIEHVILWRSVNWEAREIGGEYQFRLVSDIMDDGSEVEQRLIKIIEDGVCNKTLDEYRSNCYRIKSKGNIMIIGDKDRDYETAFVIDGRKFTPEELGELFQSYEGFNMQVQIRDESDPLLGMDEYLVPVKITEKGLLEELESALVITTDQGAFLSYKEVPVFDELYYRILEKLQILFDAMEIEKARQYGRAIAKRLSEVETDDDWFPYGDIRRLCEIVDPYGTDEELNMLLEMM